MAHSVIGIMSGSSLDGLDLAHCRFNPSMGKMEWSIQKARTIPFSASWRNRLQKATTLTGFDFMLLDAEFGIFIGETVKQWMKENSIQADLIASHGHTVFHEPKLHFTSQVGNGAHIAAISRVDTIVDFRQADIANGGQGAPLASVVDRDLFSGYDGYLNLGGIANISIFNPDKRLYAWDIVPCNQVLNFLAGKKGLLYDEGGQWSSSGWVIPAIANHLKTFFPPTLGKAFSLSNTTVQRTWIDYLESSSANTLDLLASTTEAIVQLIMDHLSAMLHAPAKILVTGGGAHNTFLLERLREVGNAYSFAFEKPEDLIIDFKESLLMAYLGYLSWQGKTFGITAVTGATQDSIGGAYYKASK